MTKYEALGELAKKATLGPNHPWFGAHFLMGDSTGMFEETAEFVAAADPDTILALLADMKAMQEALEQIERIAAFGSGVEHIARAALQRIKEAA